MADMPELYRCNFPIKTEEAKKFWASRNKANRCKAIIAFSTDLENANDNLRRWKFYYLFRKRALAAFGKYVNNPDMSNIPFSDLSTEWWVEMPYVD